MLEGNAPGETASGAEVVSYFNAHRGRTLTEVFIAPALVALLILFVGELRARVRARGENGVGPTTMMSGAVVSAAGALLGAVVEFGAVSASQHHQEQAAQTFNVLNNDDWMPFIAGIAVFMIGAGITVIRSGLVPTWLGWVALVAGVVSLAGPGGFVGYFVTPVWMIVVGIILGSRRDANPTPDDREARHEGARPTQVTTS